MSAISEQRIILRGAEIRNRPALRRPSRGWSTGTRRTAPGVPRQDRARSAEIIKHTVSWNGHHLVGTFVALLVGMGLVALRFPTESGWVNVPFHASAPVSVATSAHNPIPRDSPAPLPDPTASVSSSCEKLQEAIQNGSEADIVAGMKVVIADGAVDDTSRKVAGHYIDRDTGNESQQKRNLLILRDSCKS